MDGRPPYLMTLGELRLDGAPSTALRSPRKALALLAYLARRSPRRVRREELMALLWGERPEARARQSVRQVLLELRQVLPEAFQADTDLVGLNGGLVIDAVEFDRDISAGRLEQAVHRWHGDFLTGAEDVGGEEYRVWLEQERESLRRKLALALERLSERAVANQAWTDALRWAEVWANAAPYDERAHGRLIDALAHVGRTDDALAQHAAFVVRLRGELGEEPSAEVQRVVQGIQRLTPALVEMPDHSRVFSPDVATRSDAMAVLTAAWHDVQAGRFAAVMVQCEDAPARVRLLDEFLRDTPVGASGRLVLQATAATGQRLLTAKRLLAELRHAPGLSGAPDAALAELSELVPEIRERFVRLPHAKGAHALAAAVVQVLTDVAAEARVVVRVDEAGGADAESTELLAALIRSKPAGVLVILSHDAASLAASALANCAARRLDLKSDAKPNRRRRFRIATLAAAAFVLATGFVALLKPPARPAPAPDQLIVLPFELHGADRYTYLREGLAELLSTNLDGVSGWRTVDARSALRQVSAVDVALDTQQGRALAAKLGADLYVLGTIIEAGNVLRVQAALYRRSSDRPLVRATAEGGAKELFKLVDRLAEQILSHVDKRPAARLSRIAGLTTDSLAALKAYLDGEAALRKFLVRDAYDAFHRAVLIDSTFSLAWYGQATAASWMLAPEHALAAADAAVRHAGRLGPRDRALVDMLRAFLAGQADEAERLARMVLAYYPDDVDRRMHLAEILFHFSWRRGGSFTDADPELRRVLAADAGYAPAMIHLAQIALHQGRPAEADTLTRKLIREYGEHPSAAWMGALNAVANGNQEALTASFRQLYDAGDWWLTLTLWSLATYWKDLTAAERAAMLLADAGRSKTGRAIGHLARAHIELARGRWRIARSELGQLEPLQRDWFLEYTSLLSVAWFLPADDDQHERLLERLNDWNADAIVSPSRPPDPRPWTTVHDGLHGDLKRYLVGVLSLRTADFPEAARQAAQLAEPADTSGATALSRGLAASLRAQMLRLEGHPREALAVLEESVVEAPFEFAMTSSFWSQALERYLRAQLLAEVGRYDDASAVLRTFDETGLLDAIYRAPAQLKLGEIAERRGDADSALNHYRRFIHLWQDCDPELRPLVVEAQRRIERLQVNRRAARR